MKKSTYMLNTLLAVIFGIACLAAVLVRTFAPRIILPELDIPNMVLISLAALIVDHYVAPGAKRCYICIPLLSAFTFGLMPFAACFVGYIDAIEFGIMGAVVFTVVTWLYSFVQDRLSSGAPSKTAPVVSALGIYLAAQCLMGIF